jgi:hypothetical protein
MVGPSSLTIGMARSSVAALKVTTKVHPALRLEHGVRALVAIPATIMVPSMMGSGYPLMVQPEFCWTRYLLGQIFARAANSHPKGAAWADVDRRRSRSGALSVIA